MLGVFLCENHPSFWPKLVDFVLHSKCNSPQLNGSNALLFFSLLFCQSKICGRLIYDMLPQNREGVCVKTVTVGGRVPQRGQAAMMYSSNIRASLPRSYPKHSALRLAKKGVSAQFYTKWSSRAQNEWVTFFLLPAPSRGHLTCWYIHTGSWDDQTLDLARSLQSPGLPAARHSVNHSVWEASTQTWTTRFPPRCFKDANRSRQNSRVLWDVFFTGEMLRAVFELSVAHAERFLHS